MGFFNSIQMIDDLIVCGVIQQYMPGSQYQYRLQTTRVTNSISFNDSMSRVFYFFHSLHSKGTTLVISWNVGIETAYAL